MIISPPFLPPVGQPVPPTPTNPEDSPQAAAAAAPEDPLMDAVDSMAQYHGTYPIAWDRNWHTGVHLVPSYDQYAPVRAIADGTVVAYRVCDKPLPDMSGDLNSNAGFVLLRHEKETGDGRTLVFYSLYMHLLDIEKMNQVGVSMTCSILPHELPLWAQCPTGAAVSGNGEKVMRKDILGYTGRLCGIQELHFEIFMTQEDFASYFGSTQLGAKNVTTPAGDDCWGHAYYVIPPGQQFVTLPVNEMGSGMAQVEKNAALQHVPKNRPKTITFESLQSGKNESTLYVEVFFCLGSKYTNVWADTAQGMKLLTPQPVCEQSYEYGMYERARNLYGDCPSDGYELLRYGRILEAPTLRKAPANAALMCVYDPRQTWFRITFASGQQGYIDINAPAIQKVSDADFPAFMGWQKIHDAGHAPGIPAPGPINATPRKLSDDDGRWNPKALMGVLEQMAAKGDLQPLKDWLNDTGPKQQDKSTAMRQVVNDPVVRELLKGFICEASSEWDVANVQTRYGWLRNQGEKYENDKPGYDKLLKFVEQFLCWDKTGLPAGGKLWYFHPLGFIRHFRKCSWLSKPEMQQLLPMNYVDSSGGWNKVQISSGGPEDDFINRYRANLNRTLCKYGISTPIRMAAFFAQAIVETSWFKSQAEGGGPHKHYAPWYGRGFLQLTNSGGNVNLEASNYYNYFRWRGRLPEHAPQAQINQWRDDIAVYTKDDATQSAGFYWIAPQFSKETHYAERPSWYADTPGRNKYEAVGSHFYYSNDSVIKVADYVNAPGYIYSGGTVNGRNERYSCYTNALIVLTDTPVFPSKDGKSSLDIPDGFVLRQPW